MKKLLFFALPVVLIAALLNSCQKDRDLEVKVSKVLLNKTTLSLSVGDSETLTATVTPVEAKNRAVTWNSTDEAVASVVGGKVTALKAGTATITVTTVEGGKTDDCVVTVAEAVVPLTAPADLGKYAIPAMITGSKIADITLSGIVTGGTPPYTYTAVGLPAGVTVSPAGVLSGTPSAAAPAGTAKITVKDSSSPAQTKEITISFEAVSVPAPTHVPVTSITAVPTAATAGTPLTLTGTVNPSEATNKTITWSLKSAGGTGATLSGSTFNATAAGTATVTATIANGKTASTDYTQDFEIAVTVPAPTKTVSVGTQIGKIWAGEFNSPLFVVTTTGIAAGDYPATFGGNVPAAGLSLPNKITIDSDGSGMFNFWVSETLAAGTYNLTLTIDGTTSQPFTLTVSVPVITITTQPSPTEYIIEAGDNITLRVVATVSHNTGLGLLAYTWYQNDTNSTEGATIVPDNPYGLEYTPINIAGTTKYYYCLIETPDGKVSKISDIVKVTTLPD
jgi:uncharacterized protein YjdB